MASTQGEQREYWSHCCISRCRSHWLTAVFFATAGNWTQPSQNWVQDFRRWQPDFGTNAPVISTWITSVLVTTSKALVPRSDALVTSSLLSRSPREELALRFFDAVDALGLPKFPTYGAGHSDRSDRTRLGAPDIATRNKKLLGTRTRYGLPRMRLVIRHLATSSFLLLIVMSEGTIQEPLVPFSVR